jgi:hypothetical protein
MKAETDATLQWLLDGDPSIRWQTLRDLVGADARTAARERKKISREGWGSRLLARQNADGRWAAGSAGGASDDRGLYSPKWISTTYTLLTLRDFGLDPQSRQAKKACRRLIDGGMQPDGGVNYGTWGKWTKTSETCVTGMVLSLASYFEVDDDRVESLVDHLLKQQMPDGGWNCRRAYGATHASVHTTISVLEGLHHYEVFRRRLKAVRLAQKRGREFLLVHRMYRSHRTGEIIKPIFLRFTFPPRWHYDVLRGLDYFQAVDARRDPRLADAIDVVNKARREDGRWALAHSFKGKTYFELERVGKPSRWNTLRALRVLKWWNGGPNSN